MDWRLQPLQRAGRTAKMPRGQAMKGRSMAVVFKVSRFNLVWSAMLAVATIGVAGDALAQQPSQSQLNALRSSCRNNYMAH